MTNFKLKIASRRSKLAMVQTLWVKDQLEKNIPNLEVSVEAMATQGDKILDVALAKIGDKGLFTKELEAQMLVGQADIAVHSLKDLPTNLPDALPQDALVIAQATAEIAKIVDVCISDKPRSLASGGTSTKANDWPKPTENRPNFSQKRWLFMIIN